MKEFIKEQLTEFKEASIGEKLVIIGMGFTGLLVTAFGLFTLVFCLALAGHF